MSLRFFLLVSPRWPTIADTGCDGFHLLKCLFVLFCQMLCLPLFVLKARGRDRSTAGLGFMRNLNKPVIRL